MSCHPSRHYLLLVFMTSCWYIPKGARSQTFSIPTFAALPAAIDLQWTMIGTTSAGTAVNSQTCIDMVYAAAPDALAVQYDESSDDCSYALAIYGMSSRTYAAPLFFVRVDGNLKTSATDSCISEEDAEFLVALQSFPDGVQCPAGTFDSVSGMCKDSHEVLDNYDNGWYGAGMLTDGSHYILTADQAKDSVNWDCSGVPKMLFAGTWYCYDALDLDDAGATGSADHIRNNFCQTLIPGFDVIKVVDPREWGYAYWTQEAIYKGTTVYVGMVLASGTTYNWYDGANEANIPWTSGSPTGLELVATLGDGSVKDVDASEMTALVCKRAATSKPYDSSAKFA